MGDRDIERIFERLDSISQDLAVVKANQASQKEAALDTAGKLDALRIGGCVMGKDHDRRILNLENQPSRTINIGSAAASALSAALAWLSKL